MAPQHHYLPNPPDFNGDVLAVVDAEWRVYAAREKLCSRWVTTWNLQGQKRVQLQKDDGRGSKYKLNYQYADASGYIRMWATTDHPSLLILTVEDSEDPFCL